MKIDRFDLLLNKYRDIVAIDSIKARGYIKRLDYKNNFYLLKCIAQTYLDECRFEENSNKLRREIDFRKWRMAEKFIIASFSLNSNHAEVLYTMGEIRKLNFQNEIALFCFERIVKMSVKEISSQEYSRGNAFAKELINDSKFELYRLHFYQKPKLSIRYLNSYKKGLRNGIPSIFKPLNKYLL